MIAILSDDEKQNIGKKLRDLLLSRGIETEYISTAGLDIKPCYSCGSCNTKTYLQCCLRDDMDPILRRIIHADTWVLVSPLSWGSYSSSLKKVLDRTCILGDSHYYVKNGELVKGIRCNNRRLFSIGVKDHCSREERDAFSHLHHENITIMNISGKALVVDGNSEAASIAEEILR